MYVKIKKIDFDEETEKPCKGITDKEKVVWAKETYGNTLNRGKKIFAFIGKYIYSSKCARVIKKEKKNNSKYCKMCAAISKIISIEMSNARTASKLFVN